MLLICQDHVEIYCNPVNYHYLLPYVSHWPSLQFHCLAENEFEGEEDDAAEEFKIQALISMVKDYKILGIPYSGKALSSYVTSVGQYDTVCTDVFGVFSSIHFTEKNIRALWFAQELTSFVPRHIQQVMIYRPSVYLPLLRSTESPPEHERIKEASSSPWYGP
ncbi:forkhead box protein o-like [Plakobranchus ocellatus]|uniref:Forkhead box protein o-like n=1 Tax=Plakobranchus ocellatus TaxID=259542 RepID=A0AAV4B5C8_9GAST|nr:forkhead box protein o-like [Plakobranchus ocellatus]